MLQRVTSKVGFRPGKMISPYAIGTLNMRATSAAYYMRVSAGAHRSALLGQGHFAQARHRGDTPACGHAPTNFQVLPLLSIKI